MLELCPDISKAPTLRGGEALGAESREQQSSQPWEQDPYDHRHHHKCSLSSAMSQRDPQSCVSRKHGGVFWY